MDCLFREHRWFTPFHKVLWDSLGAITRVQLNFQAANKLGGISEGGGSDTEFWALLDWNDVKGHKLQSVCLLEKLH